jgi:hypothetical protein
MSCTRTAWLPGDKLLSQAMKNADENTTGYPQAVDKIG